MWYDILLVFVHSWLSTIVSRPCSPRRRSVRVRLQHDGQHRPAQPGRDGHGGAPRSGGEAFRGSPARGDIGYPYFSGAGCLNAVAEEVNWRPCSPTSDARGWLDIPGRWCYALLHRSLHFANVSQTTAQRGDRGHVDEVQTRWRENCSRFDGSTAAAFASLHPIERKSIRTACQPPDRAQASSEHSISVAIEAAGAAAAKKITEEAFAMEIRSETVAVDVIR